MNFWDAAFSLPVGPLIFLCIALLLAFLFEFINGFHDTANAVTTVIYTRTLAATPAVLYSGVMNFFGALITVLFYGAAVAFSIVNLLPVDLLLDARSNAALVMVLSLILAGVMWNLGTWYLGIPVSSSHTLIGCILGVGIANGLWRNGDFSGVNWGKAIEVGLGLLISPVIGFICAGGLLLIMRKILKNPKLYQPPQGDDRPPFWIRVILFTTCGAVSFAHGSNDGQKGMGLLLLVVIGFMPTHYALSVNDPEIAPRVFAAAEEIHSSFTQFQVPMPEELARQVDILLEELRGKASFAELPRGRDDRWKVRQAILKMTLEIRQLEKDPNIAADLKSRLHELRESPLEASIEYIPLWVVIGTAIALGMGTTIGYKRIVITVAEKIGKRHLTYAQGAAAEAVAAATILAADVLHLPVSTTQVLSSGIAGTMVANGSGIQSGTTRKILLAWMLTLPASLLLAGIFFILGRCIAG